MPKKLIAIRISKLTESQIGELIRVTGMSKTELISTAIERMHRQEVDKNKEKIIRRKHTIV